MVKNKAETPSRYYKFLTKPFCYRYVWDKYSNKYFRGAHKKHAGVSSSRNKETKPLPVQDNLKSANEKKSSKMPPKSNSLKGKDRINRMDSKSHNRSSVNNKKIEEDKEYEHKNSLETLEFSKQIDKVNLKDKSQSQPPLKSQSGLNLVKGSYEDGQRLISILKNHTAQINLSLSPSRKSKSSNSQRKSPDFVRLQPQTPHSQLCKQIITVNNLS